MDEFVRGIYMWSYCDCQNKIQGHYPSADANLELFDGQLLTTDVWNMISVVMLMGIIDLPNKNDYWSVQLGIPQIKNNMSRDY